MSGPAHRGPLGLLTIRAVLARFPAAGPVRRVLRDGVGAPSVGARVACAVGRVWVRRHPETDRPPGRMRGVLGFARHLAERGLPTPAPLPSDRGDDLVHVDGHWYSAWPEAPGYDVYRDGDGDDRDVPLVTAASLGAALARMHGAARGFTGDLPLLGPGPGLSLLLPPTLAEGLRALTARVAGLAVADVDRVAVTSTLEAVLGPARLEVRSRLSGLSSVPLHGDPTRANALYDPDGTVRSVLDLEDAFRGPPVADLARLVEDLALPWWRLLRGEPTAARPDLARAAIAAYLGAHPLPSEELALLPRLVVAGRSDALVCAGLVAARDGSDRIGRAWIDRLAGMLAWSASPAGRTFLASLV